ncbi:hypothetical protein [Halovenus marina]|uniref:hypothetical protein n=1 Tax=Halovenus marina TaxID=3396621 RepID=UPI003F54317D
MSDSRVSPEESNITRFEFIQERASHFESAAEDARSLLRTNFFIIGFFLPIIASFFSNQLSPERVFNNAYTQVGLVIWLVSTMFLSYTYHRSRVVAKCQFDPVEAAMLGDIPEDERRYRIQDTIDEYSSTVETLDLLISGCTGLTILATTLFALGVLLPFVSIIPQFGALAIVGAVLGIATLGAVVYKLRGYIPSIDALRSRSENGWDDLNRPRQDLLKKIYVAVGTDPFQLSDLHLKHNRPLRSGTISPSSIDDSHVLMQGVLDEKVSEYLLEQMVDEGFFEKTGNTDETTLRPPHTHEEFTINEMEDEVETAIDRLGRELDSHTRARKATADELSLRPDEVLEELRSGDTLEQIQRYNRVVDRLKEEDLDISALPFEFTSEKVTYVPTEIAQQAYEKIELEERTREHKRKMRREQEQARRAENTHRCEVIEPPDEHGEFQVYVNDVFGQDSGHERLRIDEADVSESEREDLEELKKGDEIQLRIERNAPGSGKYIASVGSP